MKKTWKRILVIVFCILIFAVILYPWKFIPEYGMPAVSAKETESGKSETEKKGQKEEKETNTEYMQVADQVIDAIMTGDIEKFWDTLPEGYLGKYGEKLENVAKSVIEDAFSDAASEFSGVEIEHQPVQSEEVSENTLDRLKSEYEEEGYSVTSARTVTVELSACDGNSGKRNRIS